VTAWTDSMIVLGWLRSSPHRWKTFVSNRVAYIQEKISPASWRYIRSSDNPADCASRGLLPAELKNHPLWWNGLTWLCQHPDHWPIELSTASPTDDTIINSETRRAVLLISTEDAVDLDRVINKFSSLSKIENIVAYLLRFANNCRVSNSTRRSGPITKNEHVAALKILVKHVQRSSFQDICQKLKTNLACPKSIQRLAPFLDEDEIIRVGGRLSNSRLCFNEKHPALLPRSHRFTRLLIEHTHKVHLHPGLKTLHFLLLQNVWILSPQRTIRSVIARCNKCFKVRPIPLEPPMAPLPAHRVQQLKPFQCVGIDFTGPFFVTQIRRRGAKSTKAYLCISVCFSTKVVHLELVSDLSTEAFLAALRRFIGRRGRRNRIVSDCGTNFQGAFRQVRKFVQPRLNRKKSIGIITHLQLHTSVDCGKPE
jgi:hypothetical protein